MVPIIEEELLSLVVTVKGFNSALLVPIIVHIRAATVSLVVTVKGFISVLMVPIIVIELSSLFFLTY